jgi:hypothetical protein
VGYKERDPQRFWLMVRGALRQACAGPALVRVVTVMPDLHRWTIMERLLRHVAPLQDRLRLVDHDVHELGAAGA